MNDFLERHKNYLKYLLLLSLITFVILFAATVAHGAWYDSNWQYRKQITIKGSEVTGGPHASFPVLIQLASDTDLAADAQDDGDDILFTSSDETTKIPHEIESFNGSNGALVAWVRVSLNANPANTIIYMYYGYASATNQQDATNVWNSNYKGVWHLEEDPSGTSPQMTDSTTNLNHGTSQGSMTSGDQVAGKIGGSLEFDGGNDYVYTTDSFNNPQNFTVSAWFKTGSASGKRVVGFESDRTGTASGSWDRHIYVGTDGKVYFGAYDGTTDVAISTNTLNDNIWHHAVGVRDDAANYIRLYIDGNLNNSTFNNFAENYIGWWRIGSYKSGSWTSGADGYFPGFIDEVRISNTDHSAQWIQTEYNNQNNPSNFIIVGSATPGGGSNNPPNVDAGSDQDVTLPNLATLDGTADSGGDGPTTPPNVTWTKQSGPGTVTFGDQYAQDTTASFSTNGIYVLRLEADDGADTAYDEVTITVNPPGGGPPIGDYSCNMKITIDHTKVSGTSDLSYFPVLISLTHDTLKNTGCGFVTSSTGDDIIFTNEGKTLQLDHEIEKYDGSTGEVLAWVEIPTLSVSTDTVIYVYYGNSGVGPQENPTGVWDSNYVAVWHLEDMNNIEDSTSYNNDGTPSNVDDDTGKIGVGQDFDGNDYITIGQPANGSLDFEENTDFCISGWFKADINTRNMTIVGQQRQTSLVFGIYDPSGDKIYFRMDDSPYHYSDSGISTGQWYHAAICYDYISGTTGYSYMYVNGVAQTTNGINTYNDMNPDSWKIGDEDRWCPTCGSVGDDEVFDGDMDEVRMSNTVRPAAWFTTSYNNQNDPSSFYSVEPPQCPSTTPQISEFACSVPITIDSSKVSGTSNLIDFPVLISLNDTGLKTGANCGYVQNSNGYDIIFSDSTQTIQLDHEVEKYDGAAGQLVAWVRIPTLSATTDTTINVHFGHASVCGATENPTGVWDSNYKGVWHLKEAVSNETTTGTHYDSTANNNDGAQNRNNDATGKIAVGQDFDGNGDFISVPNSTSLQPTAAITLSGWVKLRSFGAADDVDPIIRKGDDNNNNYQLIVDEQQAQFVLDGGDGDTILGSTTLSANTWYYIAGTWQSGGQRRVYLNGVQNGSTGSFTGPIGTDTRPFYMGGRTGTDWMDGVLDEVRISNVARSADWIKTEYNNQSDPSSFYSVGTSSCFLLSGFSCSRKITIDSSKVESTSNLTNFPVLIKIDNDCNIKTAANGGSIQNSSGWDIVFADSDGVTQLDHEIEEYDGDSGDLTAWVKIPTLPYNNDKDVYMYYGKSGLACDPSNPAGVWSNSYRGVWHLHDTSGDTQDSTSYNTDGVLSGTYTRGATGEMDNAFDFYTNGEVDWGNPAHLNFGTGEMTLSLWVNMDNHRGVWEQVIMKGKGSWQSGYQIEVDSGSNTFYFSINEQSGDYEWGRSVSIPFSLDTWTYVVGVVDRTNNLIRGYKDGVQVDTSGISLIGSIDVNDVLTIGRDTWGWPDARIEEVRLANTARSANWIKTEYNNQNDPSSFYSMSQDTCGGSYGFNYQYCKKITVDRTQVIQASNPNFPLLINLQNYDDLKTEANGGRVGNNNGWDIVFKDKNCLTLDHEIDYYDGTMGTLVAWVRIPDLTNTENYEVYMYYGDINVICSPENPDGLWDPSIYEAVYHLSDDYNDSTSNDRDGTNIGTTFTASQIGRGALFTPSNGWDYIDLGSWNVSDNDLVVQAWAWPNDFNQGDPRVVSKCADWGSGAQEHVFMLSLYNGDNGENRMRFRVKTGTNNAAGTVELFGNSPNGYLPSAQEWYFLTGSYFDSSDQMKLWRDSTGDATIYQNGWLRQNSWPVWIGASPNGTSNSEYSWDGILDEVRIISQPRSAGWITTEYRNQSDPGNFYTVGSCFEQTSEVTQEWVEEVQ